MTSSTTVTLQSPYNGTSSSATDVWNHATYGMPTGDESEAMYAALACVAAFGTCSSRAAAQYTASWDSLSIRPGQPSFVDIRQSQPSSGSIPL